MSAVPENDALTVSRTFVTGTYGLRANAIACGSFEIELNRETDIDLTISPTGCAITTLAVSSLGSRATGHARRQCID